MEVDVLETIEKYGVKFLISLFVIIGCLILIKFLVEKIIDSCISTKLSEKNQKLLNDFNRRIIAYEILLRKELNYYELIENFISKIIVEIQDVVWNYNESLIKEKNKYQKQAKECFARILELIPETKSNAIIYQNYTTVEIFDMHCKIICYIQKNASKLISIISFKEENENNCIENISTEILSLSAKLMLKIKERQDKLSK